MDPRPTEAVPYTSGLPYFPRGHCALHGAGKDMLRAGWCRPHHGSGYGSGRLQWLLEASFSPLIVSLTLLPSWHWAMHGFQHTHDPSQHELYYGFG